MLVDNSEFLPVIYAAGAWWVPSASPGAVSPVLLTMCLAEDGVPKYYNESSDNVASSRCENYYHRKSKEFVKLHFAVVINV